MSDSMTTRLPGPGRIEAVVFDLDGTLADTMALVPQVYADTIRCLGGPEVSPHEVVATWNIGPAPAVLGHFLGRTSTARDVECFRGNFQAAIAAVQPFPGIPEMLRSLRQQGYRLGIFTHAMRSAAIATLAGTGLDRFSLILVGGEEAGEPKPAPAGLRMACRRLHVHPANAAYVGDADADLRCAAAAGSTGIHARWGTTASPPPGIYLTARHPGDIAGLLAAHPVRESAVVDG